MVAFVAVVALGYWLALTRHTLVLPPLFILGTPPWLWRWLLAPVRGAFRHLVRLFLPLVRRELRSPSPVMDRLGRMPANDG